MAKSEPNERTLTAADLITNSPTALAFNVLGDRWALLIFRDLILGFRRFEELRSRTGAARGTLTTRLRSMIKNGIVYKNPYQSSPTRYEYRLTDKGLGLFPFAMLVWAWESKWTQDHHKLPAELFHRPCGKTTQPELRCRDCGEIIHPRDVAYTAGPGAKPTGGQKPSAIRRRPPKTIQPEGVDPSFFHVVDIIGDRWTGLVIAAIFFRQRRYDDIGATIGIATNILSERLKRLTIAEVIERRAYSQQPVRYEYRLTEKGRDLYGFTLMLHQWAERWLVGKRGSGLSLSHACGAPLQGVVTCSECGEVLTHGQVAYGNPAEPLD